MVLTYAERTRAYHYEEVFPDIRVSWMVGLTAAHFANEQDMMDREELVPMTEQMKAQWRSNPNREADRNWLDNAEDLLNQVTKRERERERERCF